MISVLKSYKMRKIPTNGFDFRPKKKSMLVSTRRNYMLSTRYTKETNKDNTLFVFLNRVQI